MDRIGWQKLQTSNRDGLLLSALLRISAASNRRREIPSSDKRLVISCHGFTGTKEGRGHALLMGEQLADIGFSTLLFDFAGSGESDGNNRDRTLSGQINDLSAVVEWCRREGFSEIILTGRSFGGCTVLGYAARDKTIKAVCTWAAVARLERLFYPLVGGNPEGPADELILLEGDGMKLELKRGFFQDLSKHDLPAYSAAISPRSLLVIHGSGDESVPCKDAEIIFNAASEPKKIIVIDGADHRFTDHIDEVWAAFFDWLLTL